MKRDTLQKHTLRLTLSAMLAALGVAVLALGSLFDVLDLSVAAIASFFCVYAVLELRGPYPWMIWAVTATLSLLLLPQKTAALFYLFLGHYPMLKALLERLPRAISWVVKLVWLHLSGALIFLAVRFVFLPETPLDSRPWYWVLLYVGAVAGFVLFDIALTRIIIFYLARLQKRLGLHR